MIQKKILIIEDNFEIRENTAEILELANYEVNVAENGKIGVKKAYTFKPDLIICDIMMPELDGYGVLNILSRNSETAAIPFIFLTAKSEPSDLRKGMNLGADDYIIKPFDETDLLTAIETRFKRSAHFKRSETTDKPTSLQDFLATTDGVKDLEQLSVDRKEVYHKPKEYIYREGTFANYLYYLIAGKIKCVKTDSYGKEFLTEVLNAPAFFGHTALLEDGEYHESTIALENCQIAIIPKKDFQALVEQNRSVSLEFIKLLAGNIREKEEQLLQLAFTPVRERVAAVLIKLSDTSENQIIKISREDLAGMVGTAVASLIRMLSELKKEQLIAIKGKEIHIINRLAIEELCN